MKLGTLIIGLSFLNWHFIKLWHCVIKLYSLIVGVGVCVKRVFKVCLYTRHA